MSKITKEELIERREDKFSPIFLNKLAERTGDLDLLQKVNANLDLKQEQFLVSHLIKTQKFRRDMRMSSKTWAYLKHGKLGVDAFMILFAIVGVIAIPTYHIVKQRKIKERLQSQGLAPVSVHDLSVDDEIDLDDISVHTTYYDTDAIKRRIAQKNKIIKEKEQLTRELDDQDRLTKDRIISRLKGRE